MSGFKYSGRIAVRVTSEGPTKITKATIDAAWRLRAADARLIIRDRDCRGLALVVNATSMTWVYSYRLRGTDPSSGRRWPNRSVTIGNPATHSPDDARVEANKIKGRAAAGDDPATEQRAVAEAARRKYGATLARLLREYAGVLPSRPKMRGAGLPSASYVADELAQVRLGLAEMSAENMPAAELGVLQIRQLLSLSANSSVNKRPRFGALSRFLDWCHDAGHIQANPCALISRSRRPKAPQARAHYLTLGELARLWHAAEHLDQPVWRDLARFLIAVPCRRNEAAALDWAHLDLSLPEWRQPSHMTKNRDPHRLYLPRPALDILRVRQEDTGGVGLVFPAPKSGGVVDTFSDMKAALTEATRSQNGEGSAVTGWTWHDFRRSFATALGEAGVPEAVADAVLNHRQSATRGGVLGVYQRASRWPEQVRAMEHWGRLLINAIDREKAGGSLAPTRGDEVHKQQRSEIGTR
jgi:integrase